MDKSNIQNSPQHVRVKPIAKAQWETQQREKAIKNGYKGYKENVLDENSEDPFPLANFASFQYPSKDEFGFASTSLAIFGGQGRFSAKYNTLYSVEFAGITEEVIFKVVETVNPPSGRCHHTIVGPHLGKVYLFGGDCTGLMDTWWGSYSNEMCELTISNMTWKKLEAGPQARAKHASCILNGKIYMFGGYNGNNFFGDIWEYTIETGKWVRFEVHVHPHPRDSCFLFANERQGALYVIGGQSSVPQKDVWKFDLNSKSWSQVYVKSPWDQPLSFPLYIPSKNSSGCQIGSKFVMFGGETGISDDSEVQSYLQDLLIFDSDSNEIVRTGDMNANTIYGHCLVQYRENILVLGGFLTNLYGSVFHQSTSTLKIENSLASQKLLIGSVFNTTLDAIMTRPDHRGLKVPRIFSELLDYLIEKDNAIFEGVFRKSGRHTDTIQLTMIYENGGSFNKSQFPDPNSIAVVLKKFFGSLQEPLLTFKLFDEWVAVKDPSELRKVAQKLPAINFEIAKRLFSLLSNIAQNQKVTLMGEDNLRILFTTSLLRKENHVVQLKKDDNPIQTIALLVKHYTDVFE